MERDWKKVENGSDTGDGTDARTGASNADNMWCSANESVVQEEPERKHTIARNLQVRTVRQGFVQPSEAPASSSYTCREKVACLSVLLGDFLSKMQRL
ncbi:hypothetical protein MRX96_047231 [Rhipicephalus microplus]